MAIKRGIHSRSSSAARFLIAAFAGSVVATLAAGTTPARALPTSSPDRVTVVTANLLEGFGDRDLRDMSELKVFINRLMDDLPSDPDVLLLQEVRSRSARRVADLLTSRVGQRYVVAQNAPRDPYYRRDGRIYKADTAVVINNQTMVELGRSGYIVTVSDTPNAPPQYKQNARALIRERGGSLELAVTSVHLPRTGGYKRRIKTVADKLRSAYRPAADREYVIGGDLNRNGIRSGGGFGQIDVASWRRMLTSVYGYNDSVYQVKREKGVDYVFSTGGIMGAGLDADYNKTRDRFYSDHRFRWAEIGYDANAPTTPSDLESRSWRASSGIRVKLSWTRSRDAEAGIFEYDVYRSSDGDTFRKIGSTAHESYYDDYVVRGHRYHYEVVAKDWSRNRSARSSTVSRFARG